MKLGYEHWAHWVCEDKMIRTADAAREFIESVVKRARPFGQKELAELLAELRTTDPEASASSPGSRAT